MWFYRFDGFPSLSHNLIIKLIRRVAATKAIERISVEDDMSLGNQCFIIGTATSLLVVMV